MYNFMIFYGFFVKKKKYKGKIYVIYVVKIYYYVLNIYKYL